MSEESEMKGVAVEDLTRMVHQGFVAMGNRLDALEMRLDAVEDRLSSVERKVDLIGMEIMGRA